MTDSNNPFPDTKYKAYEFSKSDMSGTKFNGVDLTDSHFWAVLKNAHFEDCNLISVKFYDVNLSNSTFENINLSNSTFSDINMTSVTFSNLNMENVEIANANLDGMKINGILVTELLATFEKSHNESV